MTWSRRVETLPPAAAWADGTAGRALARATADRIRSGTALRCALDDVGCLVLGEGDDLPWVPGVAYLGHEGGALVSTTHRPSAPADLLRRAAQQQAGMHALVVLTRGGTATCPRPEATADPARLEAWAARP